ncbi:hypothetical protein LV457_10755 [Mycobacterium sp. MYCO198283]|uniref:hypothetical protein n=1 Tax=Mycobacterium sp. MYCO198283 TaxID=2883505 RepID=UPI001E499BDA|nr:hypothetical protein [Mycobacterium sp. MYCO198283]MCG5432766.1 hypothetical protein [Mycobacterium sp. MYCO198283]
MPDRRTAIPEALSQLTAPTPPANTSGRAVVNLDGDGIVDESRGLSRGDTVIAERVGGGRVVPSGVQTSIG